MNDGKQQRGEDEGANVANMLLRKAQDTSTVSQFFGKCSYDGYGEDAPNVCSKLAQKCHRVTIVHFQRLKHKS